MANNIVIEGIEKQITNRAETITRGEFNKARKQLLSDGHAATWNNQFTYDDYKALDALLNKFLEGIAVPVAKKNAINTFVATYGNLVTEFPSLQEQAYEEGQNDGH